LSVFPGNRYFPQKPVETLPSEVSPCGNPRWEGLSHSGWRSRATSRGCGALLGPILPPAADRGWRGAVQQRRFGAVCFIIITLPLQGMFVNGLSAALDSLSSPFPCIRPISGYLQPCQVGVCCCQESWMLQVSFECAITAGDSPFPPFPGV